VRTRALGVVVEDEEEGDMGNQGMNGHDTSSEKRVADDNQEGEGEGEGMTTLYCWYVFVLSHICIYVYPYNVVARCIGRQNTNSELTNIHTLCTT
jgi:hypothetical protein